MTKKAVGLLLTILLLSLTCEAKAEPSGYVLTLQYVSDSSQCLAGTKATGIRGTGTLTRSGCVDYLLPVSCYCQFRLLCVVL